MEDKRSIYREGVEAGIPIAIGYFAVSFSLGITASKCGFTWASGFFASLFTYASAGQYVGFTLFAANATLAQLIIMSLVTNARYLLMGVALNQRVAEGTPLRHRLMIGISITDEIFGVSISRPGHASPYFGIGCMTVAVPGWALGTALGIAMGNVLPLRAVSALSVALYGMFLQVIIPPARKDKVILAFIAVSFAASYGMTMLPMFSGLSAGNRTIILTIVISAVAAALFPRRTEVEEGAADDTDASAGAASDGAAADNKNKGRGGSGAEEGGKSDD